MVGAGAGACSTGAHPRQPDAFVPVVQEDEDELVDDRRVDREGYALPALSGGTLLVTRDHSRAIVSNPDFGEVTVVDVDNFTRVGVVELDALADPGRAVEDDAGNVHVALRGAGSVITIAPQRAEVVRETSVCRAPRGLAYDADAQAVLVACAAGEIVALDPDGVEQERFEVAPDIRDLVLHEGTLYVSRMRSAELLELDADRGIARRFTPEDLEVEVRTETQSMRANTAWRLVDSGLGPLMLHQVSSRAEVDVQFETQDPPNPPYGGSTTGCAGLVMPRVTLTRSGEQLATGPLQGLVLAVDVAMSPDLRTIAVAVAGQSDEDSPTQDQQHSVVMFDAEEIEDGDECGPPTRTPPIEGQAVAVAFDQRGWLYAQTRNPALLHIMPAGADGVLTVELTEGIRLDTGHELFHQDTGAGIACASCHAEGGDDGMVWNFSDIGTRRTQALDAGLEGTAPFHWEGDFGSLPDLLAEVHHRRMAAATLSDLRAEALADWLFALPRPGRKEIATDAASRGEALFEELKCATCHSGGNFTNNQTVDVRGIALQVPNLRGVALRAPFMHDGRAETLEDAIDDMVDYAAKSRAPLSDGEMADMVTYLQSL